MEGILARRFLWPFFFFLTLVIGGVSLFCYRSFTTERCSEVPTVAINGRIWTVAIADTVESRRQGLSDTPSLAHDRVMLFVFPDVAIREFWMKDMHYPLDIIWISADHRVVGAATGVTPGSYPNTFTSPSAVPYVLEVNAGLVDDLGIASGTIVTFEGCHRL